MKISDEAYERATDAIAALVESWPASASQPFHPDLGVRGTMRALAIYALEAAALPHLTDDGVALPVRRDGEGPLAAAPSSPHQVCAVCARPDVWLSSTISGRWVCVSCGTWWEYPANTEAAPPATNHRPTCGTTYGESCDGYCPTPAIDREALEAEVREALESLGIIAYPTSARNDAEEPLDIECVVGQVAGYVLALLRGATK